MIVGTTMWGVNRMSSWFGTGAYSNPYATEPVQVGDTYIDDSMSLAAPPPESETPSDQPPGVTDPGMKAFADAQSAFYEGNYQEALTSTNTALASMPQDAVIHEFRALVLFALGKYPESAGALHPVLAVGPGWDWSTMSSLYPQLSVYEGQLRKLEGYVEENFKSPQGHFLLAYHYLTGGHSEQAAKELQQVQKLAPSDTVSAQLLQLLDSKGGGPPAEPKAESTADIDPNQLIGAWTATRGKATFEMTLDKDKGFTWSYREGKTKQDVKGAYALDGTTLSLEPDAGGVMLADISVPQNGAFTFSTVGAAKGDPGLKFKRK
jgi:tetratricopeptide (TPR) repeat protein